MDVTRPLVFPEDNPSMLMICDLNWVEAVSLLLGDGDLLPFLMCGRSEKLGQWKVHKDEELCLFVFLFDEYMYTVKSCFIQSLKVELQRKWYN